MEGVTIRDMIQTDAPINIGNSGGPLLNSSGQLIGMNTSILRGSTGIGFAVPSNMINRIVNQIIQYGQSVQSGIGIVIFEDHIARRFRAEGVLVKQVYEGSPADEAGIRGTTFDQYGRILLGDVIVSIDGDRIANYDDMYNVFDDKNPGDTVEVVFQQNGEEKTELIRVVSITE